MPPQDASKERFRRLIDRLEPLLDALLKKEAKKFKELPVKMPAKGIYLLSEGSHHLYVGRSNRLKKRLANHCRRGGSPSTSSFAVRIARKKAGKPTTHTSENALSTLKKDPKFIDEFKKAKARISILAFRFVAVPDAKTQALLEIYVHTVLNTPYNDFDNH